ncbi:Domain of unknown function (DUF2263)-containing protein [uncultured virus]|nr:Domain of unknown function (DUF2263)-containing protein [uncultured virus]
MSKKQRIKVQNQTIDFIKKNKEKFKSKIIKYDNYSPKINIGPKFKTKIQVVPLDTLEAAINVNNINNTKTGFLVFANSSNPGGRYKEGTPAQEENICRRTNLVQCFNNMKYPIPEFGSFYIKNLVILRDTEANNYKFLSKFYNMDCILSAAYHSPSINNINQLCEGFREKTRIKIISILNAFLNNGVYNIILGAFGCGAFNNPVSDISEIFHEIFQSNSYKDRFNTVTFAILKNVGINNYNIFLEKFR